MFSELAVCYLFLGGAGAGACLALGALTLLAPSFRHGGRALPPESAHRRLFGLGYAFALGALSAGALCLVFDLGRPERLLWALFGMKLSYLTVGSWSIVALFALGAAVALAWSGALCRMPAKAVRVLAAASIPVALLTALYTGLLLQDMRAVPLWTTAWLPVLFVLSSLSCGIALVLAAAQLSGAAVEFPRAVVGLLGADVAVMLAELVVLACFALSLSAFSSAGGGMTGATAQAAAEGAGDLLSGRLSGLFWGGFAVLGIVAPLVLDAAALRTKRATAGHCLLACACVLAGGAVLRCCVVAAGVHPGVTVATL